MDVVRLCAKCGDRVGLEDRFCGSCGARLPKSKIGSDAPREDKPSAASEALIWFFELFPGLVHPLVVVLSLVSIVLAAVVALLAVNLFAMGVPLASMFIGGFAVILYWAGFCWLMYGEIALPVDAMAEFSGKHWMTLILLTLAPVTALLWLAQHLAKG